MQPLTPALLVILLLATVSAKPVPQEKENVDADVADLQAQLGWLDDTWLLRQTRSSEYEDSSDESSDSQSSEESSEEGGDDDDNDDKDEDNNSTPPPTETTGTINPEPSTESSTGATPTAGVTEENSTAATTEGRGDV